MRLNTIELPGDTSVWQGEFDWTPVQQSKRYTLSGALVIETGVKLAGQPLRLAHGWLARATVEALAALLTVEQLTLVLPDNRAFIVAWEHESQPLLAEPVIDYHIGVPADFYDVKMNFILLQPVCYADGAGQIKPAANASAAVGE